ncbi:MAG: hypothetical protein IPJ51_11845 [Saprospiraceae bacterium]|nr:hypothetical protein [Saprospiraceae bacterium]
MKCSHAEAVIDNSKNQTTLRFNNQSTTHTGTKIASGLIYARSARSIPTLAPSRRSTLHKSDALRRHCTC